MKRALHFLVDHWYIPLFVGGVLLLWILTAGRKMPPVSTVKRELEAIRAGAEAREMQLIMGKEAAVKRLQKERADAIAALNAKQAQRAKELENDPVALSKFLIRAGRPGT